MVKWKPIAGFEGLYSVSSCGMVRRDAPSRGFGGRAAIGRILKQKSCANGYKSVSLYPATGKQRQINVHRLVAIAFLGPVPVGKVVNHKDGQKFHNVVTNLEYVTTAENIRHAYASGVAKGKRGEANSMAVLNNETILAIRLLANDHDWSVASLARAFRTDTARVRRILDGSIWSDTRYIPAW